MASGCTPPGPFPPTPKLRWAATTIVPAAVAKNTKNAVAPEPLPIEEILPQLLETLAVSPSVILQAPPGAGKSTLLPLALLDQEYVQGKKIIMLEPRRLAAKAVAARLAQNHGSALGETIGYRVRFENKVSAATRLEVVTEGILTRMLQSDPALEEVGLVIFDEFHERSLHADLALVLCRQVNEILRDDLKLLIMSATLDTEYLARIMDQAPILTSQGRQYPISYQYLDYPADSPLIPNMVRAIRKAVRETEGDILAFFPGEAEIRRCQEALEEEVRGISFHPLFGNLSLREQQEAIQPHPGGLRKVVLATSIAETSLTIQGITTVVDSGLARVSRFNPRTGLTRLETVSVTKDAADQRAGRAGRLGPGTAYRLWAEAAHRYLEDQRQPEILSADLAPLRLELAQWGVENVYELGWPTPPPEGNLRQAEDLLNQLEALQAGQITRAGQEMLALPTHPRIAHLLIKGREWGLSHLAADVAAMLEERDPMPRGSSADLVRRVDELGKLRQKLRVPGDLNRWKRIDQLAANWRRLLKVKTESPAREGEETGRLIAAAYPERIARQLAPHSEVYRLAQGGRVRLSEGDPLISEPWLAIAHMDGGQQEGRIFLAAPVDPLALQEMHQREEKVEWNKETDQLSAREELRIGDLVISSRTLSGVSEEAKAKVICEAIRNDPSLLPWDEEIESWLVRLQSLHHWNGGLESPWPNLNKEYLLGSLENWLAPWLGPVQSRNQLRRIDLKGLLQGMVSWDLSTQMEELAPTHLEIPTGSRIGLEYFPDGKPPVLAARLQEMFGLLDTPRVNGGQIPVLIHLLTPAMRPAAVTQDLRSFWTNVYPEVRKDLRGRYSKHYWPEDALTAMAVKGTKKSNGLK
ncbi:MAG: ATP-dependent helicase HrpB [Bacteroidia bacterium]|nr:ATP-dependent helicase HrpB [Bacteroidia bacterium]